MIKTQRHRKIRAAMMLRGIELKDIARQLKITGGAVSHVVSGLKKTPRIITALIEAGVPAKLFNDDKGKNRQKAGD